MTMKDNLTFTILSTVHQYQNCKYYMFYKFEGCLSANQEIASFLKVSLKRKVLECLKKSRGVFGSARSYCKACRTC